MIHLSLFLRFGLDLGTYILQALHTLDLNLGEEEETGFNLGALPVALLGSGT